MWVLAMCAMAVMMAVSVVAWKVNRNGKLVNKATGEPYVLAMLAQEADIQATSHTSVQFNSSQYTNSIHSGTGHFFASDGTAMARSTNHECETHRTASASR